MNLLELKRGWLMSQLRRISYKWEARTEAMGMARVERGVYQCALCGGFFKRNEIQLDHVDPVIDPEEGFKDWNTYIERLFCDADGFQVLCKECHRLKTNNENKGRNRK